MANIEDLIKTGGCIEEDEWSLTRPRFGIGEHLEVVGYFRDQTTRRKYYVVKCNECAKDPELYGAAFFKVQKGNLNSGKIPCGCSKSHHSRSKDQYHIICKRAAEKLGYTFSGFDGSWKGLKTKVRLICKDHGEWTSCPIKHLLYTGSGCPLCSGRLPEVETSGQFKQNVWSINRPTFGDNNQLTVIGINEEQSDEKMYWVECSVCKMDPELFGDGLFVSFKHNLEGGHVPCGCSVGYKRTEKQWEIICTRQAVSKGYKFSGFVQPWSGNRTRVRLVCEIHGEWSSGAISDFMLGCGCPSCVGKNQKHAYINLVRDSENRPLAIKFGIGVQVENRTKRQQRYSVHHIENLVICEFKRTAQCKAAERECKQTLDCGVLTKEEMADGWTETVSVEDLDKIISIYEKHGGKRIK